jgi:hypothetical protein
MRDPKTVLVGKSRIIFRASEAVKVRQEIGAAGENFKGTSGRRH